MELVTSPPGDRHLKYLSQSLGRRAVVLLGAVSRHLPAATATFPGGGAHLWATLPPDADDLVTTARQPAGPGGEHRHARTAVLPRRGPRATCASTFSAAADEAELDAGIRRLAAAAPELT